MLDKYLFHYKPNARWAESYQVLLQTLYPERRLTVYDRLTLGIETDSWYSDTGTDTYELGLVDHEIPAIRNTRDGEVLTFRLP